MLVSGESRTHTLSFYTAEIVKRNKNDSAGSEHQILKCCLLFDNPALLGLE